ncbi:PadR family transcriptional regulator [Desulfosporosinus sp. SYSU MS00001]|uniref:PadR family transcriptional regulator n=1 Tax=Desulfosporosinus sp. SYSU MS00001 TaxID=3416284 RepID=UPI003CF4A6DF
MLLFLTEGPSYGALLLARLQKELPFCFSDSSNVYRSLQDMERNGSLETYWEITESGPPRKWYTITSMGKQELREQAEDIRKRLANFEFFLSRYEDP